MHAKNVNNPEFEAAISGRRVLVTGHTGFTGGWLALWLRAIGCEVTGLALPPNTEPNLFSLARIGEQLNSRIGDIRDFATVRQATEAARPSVVFHLAAQPLVSRGFADPLETFATNVMGTAHVLEAARLEPSVKAVVCVTTDKVYADHNGQNGYREGDQLGGRDPYAASKAAAELVAACYRDTMAGRGNEVLIATARGGNIIGGGDWSSDRIVPDFVRSVVSGKPLTLRNPDAVRPWQHVLALVHGYLVLASRLIGGDAACAEAWNFGPRESDAVPVQELVDRLGKVWRRPEINYVKGSFPETHFLHLDSTKARSRLDWQPALDFADAVTRTAEWYREFYARPVSAEEVTAAQINRYRTTIATGDPGNSLKMSTRDRGYPS
jgi:CDP-glucose 4,6-dehydratase